MEAKILKIDEKPSNQGGTFYYVFFKDTTDGKSYRSCIYNKMRNYANWEPHIKAHRDGKEVILGGLMLKDKDLIDADSECFRVGLRRSEPAAPIKVEPSAKKPHQYIHGMLDLLDKKTGGEE